MLGCQACLEISKVQGPAQGGNPTEVELIHSHFFNQCSASSKQVSLSGGGTTAAIWLLHKTIHLMEQSKSVLAFLVCGVYTSNTKCRSGGQSHVCAGWPEEEKEMKQQLTVSATVLQQPWPVACPSELDELEATRWAGRHDCPHWVPAESSMGPHWVLTKSSSSPH